MNRYPPENKTLSELHRLLSSIFGLSKVTDFKVVSTDDGFQINIKANKIITNDIVGETKK